MMGMTQGDSQGIRCVDLRLLHKFQQMHDHHLHLLLVGPAGPSNRLLDLSGRVFSNLQPLLYGGHDRGTPRLGLLDQPKHRLAVLGVKARGGLIQKHRRIGMGEAARDVDPLLLAPRKGRG